MRTLIVTEFVSLDGVMEAPGGEPTHPHTGWTIPWGSDALYGYKFGEIMEAESQLLGRVTYEGFAQAWPAREGEFADRMNAIPKHVATSRPGALTWNATALEGDVPTAVTALKAGAGGPILVAGSGTLVHALLAHGLVDELRLMTYPVAIGGGLRVFPDDRGRIDMELAEVTRFGSVLLRIYRPAPAPEPPSFD